MFLKVDRKKSEVGEIGKGDSMTQEEELKIGEVGYKKSSDSSEKREQARETYVTLANARE